MKKTAFTISMFLLAIMLMAPLASADTINLSLANPVVSGTAGETLNFTATVTAIADGQGSIFLVQDNYAVTSPLAIDDTGFFVNFPYEVSAGDEVTDVLFSITLPSDLLAGTYTGFFSILGGLDPDSTSELATTNFTIDVASPSAVPEPGTWVLMGTGLAVLLLFVAGSRRQAAFGPTA